MSTLELILVVAAIALVAVVTFAVMRARAKRRRHAILRERFGTEYDHVVASTGSERAADRILAERLERANRFELRTLDPRERARFQERWQALQQRFVDSPTGALREADTLIVELMSARGYPADAPVEQRVEDLSVHHPHLVGHFRAASSILTAAHGANASTEDLRQATIHYRALFDELLDGALPTGARRERRVRDEERRPRGYLRGRAHSRA